MKYPVKRAQLFREETAEEKARVRDEALAAIRARMKEWDASIAEVAGVLDIRPSHLGDILSQRRTLTLDALIDIATVLGCHVRVTLESPE